MDQLDRPGCVPSTRKFAKIPMWWFTFSTNSFVRTRFVWPTPKPSVESILAADVVMLSTIRPPNAKSTARPDWANARGKCRPLLNSATWTKQDGPWAGLTNTILTDIPHRKAMPKSCRTLYSRPPPSTVVLDCAARWKKRPWWKMLGHRIAGRYGQRVADWNSQHYRIDCRRRNDDDGCPSHRCRLFRLGQLLFQQKKSASFCNSPEGFSSNFYLPSWC